jgi:hypothetical protein
MQELNLPTFEFKIKQQEHKKQIFDSIRKKYVALTPEEWVRQHFIHFLVFHKNYPASRIAIEASLKLNQLQKRADILIYDKSAKPHLMVECKAPDVKITQDTFDQIARYNMVFNVNYLVVTNGIQHFCCEINYTNRSFTYLKDIPSFE